MVEAVDLLNAIVERFVCGEINEAALHALSIATLQEFLRA